MLWLSLPSASTEDIAPTVGFVNGSTRLSGCNLSLLDLGGGERLREIWHNYYAEVRTYVRVMWYIANTHQSRVGTVGAPTLQSGLEASKIQWNTPN